MLRSAGQHFEIISNGVFLMDTRGGRSERLLVTAALQAHPDPRSLLIAGLGVGFSLAAAVADTRLETVTVVEIEPTLLRWYDHELGGTAHRDPRVRMVVGDVAKHDGRYDVICLDVDNGPDWTVTEANTNLYDDTGTARLANGLNPGGVLAVWSARDVPAYGEVLRRHFTHVEALTVPVERGEPDVVYLGRSDVSHEVS